MNDGTTNPLAVIGGVLLVIFIIWAFIFGIDWISSRATPQAGQIGVVRNGPDAAWIGSWFNGHGLRSIVKPGSGSTYVGLGSSVHYYPDSTVQRQYTISSIRNQGDRPGVDYVQVPTSDGVDVTLNGSFYFKTAFCAPYDRRVCPQGVALVKDFDSRFGIRTFTDAQSGQQFFPYEGITGWEAFLDGVVRPIVDNDLRKAIGSVSCEQLVSSCALVHNSNSSALVKATGTGNQATIQRIQDQINSSLESDIASTLGEDYFSSVSFLLGSVKLPNAVQGEINNAQATYAGVATSAARVQQARQDAQANAIREQGYKNCAACAQIDELKAIPPNVTTYAPGGPFSVTH